jgi:hypothetical protein
MTILGFESIEIIEAIRQKPQPDFRDHLKPASVKR